MASQGVLTCVLLRERSERALGTKSRQRKAALPALFFLRTSLPRASLSLPCRPYSAACPLDGVDGCAPPVIPARSRSIRWLMYSGERVLRAT